MQLSHYLKIYPYEERPGYLLVYSTRKASAILLGQKTYHAIERAELSSSNKALLSKLGVIVRDREEEKRAMLGFIKGINSKNTGLSITVVLNLDCNFSCIYCYEEGIRGKLYMSDDTAERLTDFIKEQFTKDKKALHVDFYGGEPLLSIGLIKSISRDLTSFTQSRGASYSFTLVTNGSLFKRHVAKELAEVGLKSVKITLDGPEEIHDRYRPFKSGAGSFDTIIRNIKDTHDLVRIGIGGNFDRSNYERFALLLDRLSKEGLTPERISGVKFDPISNRPQGDVSPTDYREGCVSINEPWLVKAEALLREQILKRGYNTLKPRPMSCMIEITDSYVVNFDGVIYKCPGFIGKEGFAIGHIQTGIRDYASSYKIGLWKNEACIECEYLPLCFGGCRYMKFVREGNIDTLDCRKDYLDASLETLIKQDIKYRQKAKSDSQGVARETPEIDLLGRNSSDVSREIRERLPDKQA